MSTVDQQVSHARRRLTTNILFQRLALGVIIAAGMFTLVVLVERLFVLGVPLGPSALAAVLVAALIGVVGAGLARVQPLGAALAIDQAAGLKERLSTSLSCRRNPDAFARAAVKDAEKTAARLHVPSHLPYRPPQLWPWSLACVAAAMILGLFLPTVDLLAEEEPQNPAERTAVVAESKNITAALRDRMDQVKELAQKNPEFQDLVEDIQPLELPDEPTATPEDIRREAAKRIDSVSDKLAREANSDELDALKQLKRMMARISPQQGDDAAAQLSNALASGDFEQARQSLAELKDQLDEAAQSNNPESVQELAQLQKKLDNLSKQLEQLSDSKDLQKALEKQANMSPEQAKKLLEKLAQMDPKQLEKELQRQLAEKGMTPEQIKQMAKKMANQKKACKACQGLGQALAQAAQAAQQGKSSGGSAAAAAAALGDAMNQMSDLEMAEQMMDELELQLAELQDLRDGITEGEFGQGRGEDGGSGGTGGDIGRGYGANPKERAAYKYKPTKAQAALHPGQIIGQMLIDGPQVKGEAAAEVRDAVNSAVRDAEDAIERDRVPRQYQKAVQAYFDRLAGVGEQQKTQAEPGAVPAQKPAPAAP
ncbi:MAG: hypothetical protein KKB50_14475 [Planctomycetes bacterium]|nr:hypothetical protein [Planctomycetota bacterium]